MAIFRPARAGQLTEHEAELWEAFLDAYLSSKTRPVVDAFLGGIIRTASQSPQPGVASF